SRRRVFDKLLKEKRIEVDYDTIVPQSHYQADSVRLLLSLGRVIRDNQAAKNADVILSWKNYDPTDRLADPDDAIYLLNGKEVGRGIPGVLRGVARTQARPHAAVLRLEPVCLRTTGPFPCPYMLAGQRHFARSGKEPYHTLLELLAEVATRNQLQVELLPDE